MINRNIAAIGFEEADEDDTEDTEEKEGEEAAVGLFKKKIIK